MFTVEGKTPEATKNAQILEKYLNATFKMPIIPEELLKELIEGTP